MRSLRSLGLESGRGQVLRDICEPLKTARKRRLQHYRRQSRHIVTALPYLIGWTCVGDDGAGTGIILDDVSDRFDDVIDGNRSDPDSLDLHRCASLDHLQSHQVLARFIAESDEVGPVAIIEQVLTQAGRCRLCGIDGHWRIRVSADSKVGIEKGGQAGDMVTV